MYAQERTEKIKRLGDLAVDGAESGALYLLTSSISDRYRGQIDLLHVISKPAGGEIRGYWRAKDSSGPWKIGTPNYTGAWPEVDAAVVALTGFAIEPASEVA